MENMSCRIKTPERQTHEGYFTLDFVVLVWIKYKCVELYIYFFRFDMDNSENCLLILEVPIQPKYFHLGQ